MQIKCHHYCTPIAGMHKLYVHDLEQWSWTHVEVLLVNLEIFMYPFFGLLNFRHISFPSFRYTYV